MASLKDSLKGFMKQKSINSSQLARETGIKQPVIHRLISGETLDPKIGTIAALANYFDVSINELVGQEKCFESEIPLISLDNISEYFSGKFKPNNFYKVSDKDSKNCIAIQISDSTMLPRFPKDTIIILNPKFNPKDRDYVVVFIAEKNISLFRQLLLDGSDTYIKPLNPDFPLFKLSSEFKILGVVTEAIMKFGDANEVF